MANPKFTPVNKPHVIPSPTPKAPVPGKKELYYRIQKITGHLTQLLELEIDESTVTPRVVGKADLPMLIQDKAMQMIYPSVDDLEKRARLKKQADKKAEDDARGNK